MPTRNLSAMSIEALMKLRQDINKILDRKATELQSQLKMLGAHSRATAHPLKGKKAPVKYRDRSGNTWAGRGAKPRWLVAALKQGKKLKDFEVKAKR
jgi:DNA-binding protein H-NS